MPKIPLYDPQVNMVAHGPNVEVDTKSYGVEGRQIAQSWKDVGKFGEILSDAGMDFTKKIRQAQQVSDASDAYADSMTQLFDLRNKVRDENPDPATWPQAFREGARQVYQDISGNLKDMAVQSYFKRQYTDHFVTQLQGVMNDSRHQQIENLNGNVEASFPQYLELAVQAPDDLTRQRVINNWNIFVDGMTRGGALNPDKGEKLKQSFDATLKWRQATDAAAADPANFDARKWGYTDGESIKKLDSFAQQSLHLNWNKNDLKLAQMFEAQQLTPESLKDMRDRREISPAQHDRYGAYLEGNGGYEHNEDNYRQALGRLYDLENPLSPQEIMANIKGGEWKFDTKHYEHLLNAAESIDRRTEKAEDTAFKARINYWKTQFGSGSRSENFMMGLGQAQAAKDEGNLGKNREEINAAVDGIFAPHHNLYMQEWGMGNYAPKPGVKQTWGEWIRRLVPGSVPAPAQPQQQQQPRRSGSIRNDMDWMSPDLRGSK